MPETNPERPVPEIDVAPKPLYYWHKVRWPNESLSLISQWYTGNTNNWNVLAKENPTLNPNKIIIGDMVSIPPKLLTARTPMPRSFVNAAVQTKRKAYALTHKKSTIVEPPELYGPIESDPGSPEYNGVDLFPPIE